MRTIFLITFLMMSVILIHQKTHASEIKINICKEKGYDCQVIPLTDVKKIEKISNGDILRITFYNNEQLDIDVSNKYYEIKK